MKYVALLRGINVGGNRRVDMKKLKALLQSLNFTQISTYINSGNILLEGKGKPHDLRIVLEQAFHKEFGFEIPTLVKTATEMKRIADAIPTRWKNDADQRTDVAYLFPEIDNKRTVDELPVKKEFLEVLYVKGAIIWHVKRKFVFKSQLAKIISHPLYRSMTVRNVNTARRLASEP